MRSQACPVLVLEEGLTSQGPHLKGLYFIGKNFNTATIF